MRNLPLACMNAKRDNQIKQTLGLVLDNDVKEDDNGWGPFLCVVIELDITKPIARGRTVNLQGNRMWILFTYEKLPCLCFRCC